MKVNVLVAAAMVITSVNAGWHRRLRSLFGRNDRRPGSVFPQDLTETGSSMSQDTEPTNKESSNDSDMNGIGKNLICDFLISTTKGLQASLVGHADEFRGHLALLHILQAREDTLKDEQRESHSASTGRVNGRLEAIKGEFAKLQAEYSRFWTMLVDNECLAEDYYLIGPQDMARVGVLLDVLQKTPRNASVHGDDVVSLDRQ
ncbi:hypothetical protein BASA50_010752 [Batrachochytrium salamandrivorans]|uniref:Uncharacterized protein n=1 Tax=Batrachochytrium salamandrivorans TaxID=1357716 RepID=A0ABQ8EXP0_9FUNG|nr:hypothetical protein BASA50_010752 [Batrachochytrium salamandrivorans]